MDITTVKLHKDTKQALDAVRQKEETYDEVISRLLDKARRKMMRNQMIEGYKQTKEALTVLEEWEPASSEVE